MLVVFILGMVSLLSSVIGSICGIGGGVIIKPVLDATGIMSVSAISFLSGCTVLTMTVVSVGKNMRSGAAKMDLRIATALAAGAALGGAVGKWMFQAMKEAVGKENLVGMTQAFVLLVITLATLIYTVRKGGIRTKRYDQIWICGGIGILLGIFSSFLGIGGGPINLMVLGYFFSMSTKEAALSSLYIIMFSQVTSLVQTLVTGSVPKIRPDYLIVMVLGGMAGGAIGSRINRKIPERRVDRLFIALMTVIIGINIYNIIRFAAG